MKAVPLAAGLVVLAGSVVAVGAMQGNRTQPQRVEAATKRLADTGSPVALANFQQTGQPAKPGVLAPGLDDAKISMLTSRVLVAMHFLQQEFGDDVSSKFLDRYIDALDPLHLFFFESDLKEFEPYRTTLDERTRDKGDTAPAYAIFTRLLQRVDQQKAAVGEMLKTEKFDFSGDEAYQFDRSKAPHPKDLADAKRLWRERLRFEYLQEKLNKKKPEEIVTTITKRYDRLARALHEYDSDDVFQLYLTSLSHVYDPHSDYLGKASYENFGIRMKLSLFGIGAVLRSEDGYCQIVELTPGGPALRSGQLKPGDKIVAVAQGDNGEPVDVIDMKLDKIVEMIRGAKGTVVRLTVIPADAADPSMRKNVRIVREEVKLEDQEAKARILELPANGGQAMRLGVIDLPSFYEGQSAPGAPQKSCTKDVAVLLNKLTAEGVDGVILDLRKNGGGSLEEAISLTGLFIKSGPVVQIKSPDGALEVENDRDVRQQYAGPLVVLTSRHSASASEILAGALQDYGRALVVGESTTHGKGTVQSLMQLGPIMTRQGVKTTNDPGALKLTIRKFYRASGKSTQLNGVVPDIVLPSLNNDRKIGEAALENALPYDEIKRADYQQMNLVQPYMASLKAKVNARTAKDKDFLWIRQEAERLKKTLDEKEVSLNEQERLKEKEEAAARAAARKKEIAARPKSQDKLYVISLKNAGAKGLPAPLDPNKPLAEVPKSILREDDDAPAADVPANDIHLEETKRILADFIRAMKQPVAATTAAAQKK